MHVEWYGQSAFRLTDDAVTVFIDPFDDLTALAERGVRWEYPAIEGVEADLLLVTHEHLDHNGVGPIGGEPVTLRSTAGRLESPVGEVVAVASEHDAAAGTERGPNTLFAFTLGGRRVAHLGDLGQSELREEQAQALGRIDLLFVPVGDGPTIGAEQAAAIAARLGAQVIVPMHYRTERIGFLEPVDAFLQRAQRVERLESSAFDLEALAGGDPVVVVPAAP
ncbi:MAG TPA: MBL fold metallo-hydrolase [Solirubrobacteraceae bacterium]|nr:MBL fold metallo-hydrolase [Solirubrobacteraceae bacterium]